MRPGDANGPGSQTDWLEGQVDMLRGQTDTLTVSNNAEMAGISHSDEAETYLKLGDAKRLIHETDGVGSYMDTLNRLTDVLSIKTNSRIPANVPDNVRTPQKKIKPPDIPDSATRGRTDEPAGCRNHMDTSRVSTDGHSVKMEMETAANEMRNVRMHQKELRTQNSPIAHETKPPKPTNQWKRVSDGNSNMYIP